MNQIIDVHELELAFLDCFYSEEEMTAAQTDGKPPKGSVIVEGVRFNFAFHPERLEAKREKVKAWLELLPEKFKKSNGGGWSFLNAAFMKDGTQWGEHKNVEQLMALAIGLKLGSFPFPREMWLVLPGKVPYFAIED